MAKHFEIVETEDRLQVRLPPLQRVHFVLALTVAAAVCVFGSLWWTCRWLTAPAVLMQGLSQICAGVLFVLAATAMRLLSLELATTTLTFERTTIEVRKTVLCLGVSRRWYSCYGIRIFLVEQLVHAPDLLRVTAVTAKDSSVVFAGNMPNDTFTQLVHRTRRKEFAYFQEDTDADA